MDVIASGGMQLDCGEYCFCNNCFGIYCSCWGHCSDYHCTMCGIEEPCILYNAP